MVTSSDNIVKIGWFEHGMNHGYGEAADILTNKTLEGVFL